LASSPGADPQALAQREVRRGFPRATSAQSDLLAFYILSSAAQAPVTANQARQGGGGSELTSLQLQMQMDRRSKLMATLSNLLKKIADTEDGIVQNLK
jgi:hypothetical protein